MDGEAAISYDIIPESGNMRNEWWEIRGVGWEKEMGLASAETFSISESMCLREYVVTLMPVVCWPAMIDSQPRLLYMSLETRW